MRLHSGAPFWLVKDGLRELRSASPPPDRCDVVVIGAGITGALVADALTAEGLAVVVLDRRAPACGSTAASTALLSYEIDLSLADLIERRGERDAVRAYQMSAAAIDDLARVAASLPDPCGFARGPSLYLARRPRDARMLQEEVELRRRCGLDAEYWPAERIEQAYGIESPGALRTSQAGVLDPVRFTRALLERAMARGALLLSRTPARDIRQETNGPFVVTNRGTIAARWVVYAMGYEMPEKLRAGMVSLHSTYALVTEPLDDLGPWRDGCILWDTGRPYYYMRATEDRRLMIGGADTPFKNPDLRDRLMPARMRLLEKQLSRWLPGRPTETAFMWGGTFGDTDDGLPYIGPRPDCPQALYALGYGANGITFGAVAARILGDLCLGRPNDDVNLFRLDR